jgi:hypothetical protein
MVKATSYPFPDKVAQRHHPTDKRVPRGVLLSIGIRLDLQAIIHGGDRALEQLSLLGLGLEEALEGVGRRLSYPLLLLQLWNTSV